MILRKRTLACQRLVRAAAVRRPVVRARALRARALQVRALRVPELRARAQQARVAPPRQVRAVKQPQVQAALRNSAARDHVVSRRCFEPGTRQACCGRGVQLRPPPVTDLRADRLVLR